MKKIVKLILAPVLMSVLMIGSSSSWAGPILDVQYQNNPEDLEQLATALQKDNHNDNVAAGEWAAGAAGTALSAALFGKYVGEYGEGASAFYWSNRLRDVAARVAKPGAALLGAAAAGEVLMAFYRAPDNSPTVLSDNEQKMVEKIIETREINERLDGTQAQLR